MERRLLHRAGYVVGGLVLVAGSVVALRTADTPSEQKVPPPPPVQTTVKEYADASVLVPHAGAKPGRPGDLHVIPGPHRLQVTWANKAQPLGYDVRLRGNGVDRTQLVADDATQFDGLENDKEYEVEVRAVDSYGQRSEPVVQKQRPSAKRPDESRYAVIDHFDGPNGPDPARWQLAYNAACARMSKGTDDDHDRLVISAACGTESAIVRSRTPLRLKDNNGELGRMMIETDAPAVDGELTLDLVPGPVDLVETAPRGDTLIPGLVRVRITRDAVRIPGFPDVPLTKPAGVSTRWELVLRTDGLSVWRNGTQVAAAPVVPTWTEATPLFGFAGPPNGLNYVGVEALGLSSSDTPAYAPAPRVTTNAVRPTSTVLFTGALSAQLRITIRANRGSVVEPFTVDVAGRSFPARPAVDGQRYEAGTRYPLVVDLPPDALQLSGDRGELQVSVRGVNPQTMPLVQHVALEIVPSPNHLVAVMDNSEPAQRPRQMLASIRGTLLDASGSKIESGTPSPRGRVVLDVSMSGVDVHAGLAGVELWIDNRRVAGIPTTVDGPAVLGQWRIALNAGAFAPGVHNVELKAISTDGSVSPEFTSLAWQVPS